MMKRPSLMTPNKIYKRRVNTAAANKYSTPCSLTNDTINNAVDPVAPEIIPIRPPVKEMTMDSILGDFQPLSESRVRCQQVEL
ncbi:hypothetical protein [Alicyclobacillus fastidiosus]|uniref:Uncharacterized protein n=1 Tax=Alicyclobacillus fastidiosus TaxID=392011 RepID=A0ABV5AEX6_9BACL|nr:hypothetical protein [Alicyclobacillus fastidiosus]WEH12176.1 hypothetical protein PYS47_23005 [Alicyclobacillus fastidiosus]